MQANRLVRWSIPLVGLLVLAGYFGPWVHHPVAGLVIAGLDLGEYVKFLPAVRNGQLAIWREGFYLPLVAVSLTLSLSAFRRPLRYPRPVRALLLAMAIIAALNLLPPAWTPARMMTPEFRLQATALVVCLAAVGFSPILALVPRGPVLLICILLCGSAIWFPVRDFLRVLPGIAELYRQPLQPGWGIYVVVVGLLCLAVFCILTTWLGRNGQNDIGLTGGKEKHASQHD